MTDGKNNTGIENSGNWNSGDRNSGSRNSGDWNSGDRNSGNWNSGNRNSGNRNSGDWNSGDWNDASLHVGCFNTIDASEAYYFNEIGSIERWNIAYKPRWLYEPSPATWVEETDMTDEEKKADPEFHVRGGYLRKNDMREEWLKAYESASAEDIQAVRDLPYFDYDVFEEITGLDLREDSGDCVGKIVEIDGKKYRLEEIE